MAYYSNANSNNLQKGFIYKVDWFCFFESKEDEFEHSFLISLKLMHFNLGQ